MSGSFVWDNFYKKADGADIYALLGRVPIFDTLSKGELKLFEHILHRRVYAKGEFIFREGDTGSAMYIIEDGEVSLEIGKSRQEISHLANGDFFGEIALFADQPRSASALAFEETRIFGFSQHDLLGLLETHPKTGITVVMKLTRIIADRLHRATIENTRLLDTLIVHTAQ
ncbi:MAG: cyclic nucleotide-binding domain-containing protein [Ignavibacteria bacterium]|nr:cyclic nucleotide-binding domain-containing protein [Ignavibacteria bacterium]